MGDGVMVNATEMANPFGKRPTDWLRLPSTVSFINSLTEVRKNHNVNYQAIKIVKGGKTGEIRQGTWFHEDVALEFARWLAPEFAIWCNDRIKELFRHGVTATPEAIEKIITDPENFIKVVTALRDERAEKGRVFVINAITTINARMVIIMNHYGLNKNSFSMRIGMNNNVAIGSLVNDFETRRPSYDVINKVLSSFPEVSGDWLLTGKGKMLAKANIPATV